MKQLTAILTTVVLAIALSANGQPPQGQGRMQNSNCAQSKNMGAKHDHMFKMLDLSVEQKEKIKSLKLEHQKNMLPIRNEIGEKKAKLQTLTTTDPIDRKAVDALVSEIGTLRTKMMIEKVNHRLNVRSVLNEEQKIKFDSHKPMCEGKGKNGYGKF